MNLNKQQSEKYLEIVRRGNMDDMFDFGRECGCQAVLNEVEGWLVDEKKERKVEAPGYYKWEIRNHLRKELRAKVQEMRDGK